MRMNDKDKAACGAARRTGACEDMALSRQYLDLLGLELVKNKYYPAEKVEKVLEDLGRMTAELGNKNKALESGKKALEDANRSLEDEKKSLEEEKSALGARIGELEARGAELEEENARLKEKLDSISGGCEEIGEAILSAKTISQQFISEAREEADRIVSEAKEKAERTVAEAEEKSSCLLGDREEKLRAAEESMRSGYERIRAQYLEAIARLDESMRGPAGEAPQAALPGDIGGKLGRIAEELAAIGDENE